MRKQIIALVAALAVVSQLNAASIPLEPPTKPGEGKPWTAQQVEDARAAGNLFKPATELWRAHEFSVAPFGAVTVSELSEDGLKDHDAGAGIEFAYFFTRNIGLSLEARHVFSKHENPLNHMGAHLTYRLPLGPVAPYAFAGAGYRYDGNQVDLRLYGGAGVEFRLNGNVGVFTDVRAVTTEKFESVLHYVGRAGVRFSF